MNNDILTKEKLRIDRLARKHFSAGHLLYLSNILHNNYLGRYLSCSIGVFHPNRSATLTWELCCMVTLKNDILEYDLYESGKFIGKYPKKSVIKIIRSRLNKYMETGYKELVQQVINAERNSILKAIEELP